MIAADLVRACLAFALPFVDHDVFNVYLIAIGLSAAAVFFNPAAQSVLPSLVKERELVAANLISLLLGGIAADIFGIRAVFYIGGVLLLAAATIGWAGLRNTSPTT